MLDYLTAGIAFWMTLFGVQESLLEFRLGYLGRYWFVAISASLFIGFLLSALVTVPLIINLTVDPFTFPGNVSKPKSFSQERSQRNSTVGSSA